MKSNGNVPNYVTNHDLNFNNSTGTKVKEKSITILTSNICGFKSKVGSLINILSEKNVDIACISETHCEGDTIPLIKGFSTYHRNRSNNKAKGGIAMLFRQTIAPWVIKLETGLDENEFFTCKISCFEPEVVLVLQYGVIENRHSVNEIAALQSEVFSVVKGYCDEGYDVFWTGDLNVHLGNQGNLNHNNPHQTNGGRNLLQFIELENLHLCNWDDQSHTHLDRSGGSSNILDLMITNAKDKIKNFTVDKNAKHTPFRVRKVKTGLAHKLTDHLSLFTTFKTQVN